MVPFSFAQSRFLEASLVWQAYGGLKNSCWTGSVVWLGGLRHHLFSRTDHGWWFKPSHCWNSSFIIIQRKQYRSTSRYLSPYHQAQTFTMKHFRVQILRTELAVPCGQALQVATYLVELFHRSWSVVQTRLLPKFIIYYHSEEII